MKEREEWECGTERKIEERMGGGSKSEMVQEKKNGEGIMLLCSV